MTLQRNQIDLDRNICEISETNNSDSDDDTFIADKTFIISNPFFSRHKMIINDKYCKFIDLNQKEIRYNYDRIFIICQKNNIWHCTTPMKKSKKNPDFPFFNEGRNHLLWGGVVKEGPL